MTPIPMTVESLFIHRIHSISSRHDKIWGQRTAFTLDVDAGHPVLLLLPGEVQLVERQWIHVVRWKPGSPSVVAFLIGSHDTPRHITPESRFGLAAAIALNNGMGLYYCLVVEKLPVLLLLGLSWLVGNVWLIHGLRERSKLKQALLALHAWRR